MHRQEILTSLVPLRKDLFSPRDKEVIPHELFNKYLGDIAMEREKPGTSEILIPQIKKLREKAIKQGEYTIVALLYQEQFLSAQHVLIEEKSKLKEIDPFRAVQGKITLESTVVEMKKYDDRFGDKVNPFVRARNFRFYGRLADSNHQYALSEKYYRKALTYYHLDDNFEDGFPYLEINGFLGFSQLNQGKLNEGLLTSQASIHNLKTSPIGIELKEKNFYTWAVWKTGIEIRTTDYIINHNTIDRSMAVNLINDAQETLYTDKEKFAIRIMELEKLKSQMPEFSPAESLLH